MRFYEKAVIEAVVLGLRDSGAIDEAAIRHIARRLETGAAEAEQYGRENAAGMRDLAETLTANI